MRLRYILTASLIVLLSNCKEDKLTHPITVKGMKLGLEPNEQLKIGLKNGLNEEDFEIFDIVRYNFNGKELIPLEPKEKPCQYKLTNDIVVHPKCHFGYFQGEKVLTDVDLLFHSLSEYTFLTFLNQNGKIDVGRPAVSWNQVKEIISKYDKKYGKGRGGNIRHWIVGDLSITLIASEYTDIEEKGACLCAVNYTYIKEKRKLLSFTQLDKDPI